MTGTHQEEGTSAPQQFGPFDLLRSLGRGGAAEVYLAERRSPRQRLAIKILSGGSFASAEARHRFRREVELVARLRHEHILAVHEPGELDGIPYYTMDYVEGGDLRQALTAGRLSWRELADVLRCVAGALDYAHRHGVLHRDVKPANVLLDAQARPLLADFGLARDLTSNEQLTATFAAVGSPNYMAPEQARGDPLDGRTDVYAIGAMLYEGLTGRTPHTFDSPLATLRAIADGRPIAAPSAVVGNVPRDLEAICVRCLEAAAQRRYPDAGALADDLRCFVEGRPVSVRPRTFWDRATAAAANHWRAIVVTLAIAIPLAIYLQTLELERRATRFAGLQGKVNALILDLERGRDDLKPLRALRGLHDSDPDWPGWPESFAQLGRWATDESLLSIAVELTERAHGALGTDEDLARLRFRLGDMEGAARIWRRLGRGDTGARRRAELAERLSQETVWQLPFKLARDSPRHFNAAATLIDLDRDGRRELVFSTPWPETQRALYSVTVEPDDSLRVMEIELPDDFVSRDVGWLGGWDADRDGFHELVVKEKRLSRGGVSVLELDESGTRLRIVERIDPETVIGTPSVADTDGDGADELLLPHHYPDRTSRVCYSTRAGSARACEPLLGGDPEGNNWRLVAADADGDGTIELHQAVGCYATYGLEAFSRSDSPSVWQRTAYRTLGRATDVLAMDVDGDATTEIVAGVSSTPYDPVLAGVSDVPLNTAVVSVQRYQDGRYTTEHNDEVRLSSHDRSARAVLRGGIAIGPGEPPWIVWDSVHDVAWNCCNWAPIRAIGLSGVGQEPLFVHTLKPSAVGDVDGDGRDEILTLDLDRGELRARGRAPQGRTTSASRSAEPSTLGPLLGPHADRSELARLFWVLDTLDDTHAEAAERRISALEYRLGSTADPILDSVDSMPIVASWRAGDGLARWQTVSDAEGQVTVDDEGRIRVGWEEGGKVRALLDYTLPSDRAWSARLWVRPAELPYGRAIALGVLRSVDRPTFAHGLQLATRRTCTAPGGYRHQVDTMPVVGRTGLKIFRQQYDHGFRLGLVSRFVLDYSPDTRRVRLRLHPAFTEPTASDSVAIEWVDVRPTPAGYRLGVATVDAVSDRNAGPGELTIERVEIRIDDVS